MKNIHLCPSGRKVCGTEREKKERKIITQIVDTLFCSHEAGQRMHSDQTNFREMMKLGKIKLTVMMKLTKTIKPLSRYQGLIFNSEIGKNIFFREICSMKNIYQC